MYLWQSTDLRLCASRVKKRKKISKKNRQGSKEKQAQSGYPLRVTGTVRKVATATSVVAVDPSAQNVVIWTVIELYALVGATIT